MKGIGAIILAAGASRRLGIPKQLVRFQGVTLVRRAALAAAEADCAPVVVVSGAEPHVAAELEDIEGVMVVQHVIWQAGMGGSIRAGVAAVEREAPATRGAVLMACDQPMVDGGVIAALIERHLLTGRTAVASRYGGMLGIPAFFGRSWFPLLKRLPLHSGARRILAAHRRHVGELPFPAAAWDIDTEADLERLRSLDYAPVPAAAG